VALLDIQRKESLDDISGLDNPKPLADILVEKCGVDVWPSTVSMFLVHRSE
jgi:hypothetical protein